MILVPFDDPKKHCSIIQYREAKFKQHKHSKIWTRYFKTITFKCLAVPRIGISENYILLIGMLQISTVRWATLFYNYDNFFLKNGNFLMMGVLTPILPKWNWTLLSVQVLTWWNPDAGFRVYIVQVNSRIYLNAWYPSVEFMKYGLPNTKVKVA